MTTRLEGQVVVLEPVRDSAYYSVIDEEWPRVRANLERRLAAAPGSAPT
jgi:hypothetical protein